MKMSWIFHSIFAVLLCASFIEVEGVVNFTTVNPRILNSSKAALQKSTTTFDLTSTSKTTTPVPIFVKNGSRNSTIDTPFSTTTAATTSTTTDSTTTTTTTVQPHSDLKFISRLNQDNRQYDTFVGSDFTFDCRVNGFPEPNITWLKDEKPLHTMSYRMLEHSMEKVFTLILKDLLVADTGIYKCTADNGISNPITTSLKVNVQENPFRQLPEIVYFSPKKAVIKVGESITFFCNLKHVKDVKGPFIKWTRYSYYNATIKQEVTSNKTNSTADTTTAAITTQNTITTPAITFKNAIYVERLSNITHIEDGMIHQHVDLKLNQCEESYYEIKSATLMDTGEYSCMVFNDKGYNIKTAYLTVVPVPPLSKEELETIYIEKYGSKSKPAFPLPVIVGLPVFLMVLLIIGCVYVRENHRLSHGPITDEIRKPQVVTTTQNTKKQPLEIFPRMSVSNMDIPSKHSRQSFGDEINYELASNKSLPGSRLKDEELDGDDDDKTALLADLDSIHDNDNTSLLVEIDTGNRNVDGDEASSKSDNPVDPEWIHVQA